MGGDLEKNRRGSGQRWRGVWAKYEVGLGKYGGVWAKFVICVGLYTSSGGYCKAYSVAGGPWRTWQTWYCGGQRVGAGQGGAGRGGPVGAGGVQGWARSGGLGGRGAGSNLWAKICGQGKDWGVLG